MYHQFLTAARIYYNVEIANYLTNIQSESYIKEKIMIPDITKYFDNGASCAACSTLQINQFLFSRFDKEESKLTQEQVFNQNDTDSDEEIDVVNVDERNIAEGSNNIEADNFDKNRISLVCPKCTRKEKLLSTSEGSNCQDCKEPMNYECLTCGNHIKTIKSLQYHIGKKCERQHRTFQCEECSYEASNEYLLHIHVMRQHRGKPECPKCSKKVTRKHMNRHISGCGINLPYLKCTFCPFDTKYKGNLVTHMRKVHTNIKSSLYAGIIKKITEEGEKIKANTLNLTDSSEVEVLSTRTDCKKFIQQYCPQCDEVWENADYRSERDCRKCGATMLVQCVKCKNRYSKMNTMYAHLRQKCAARKHFQCVDCDYVSTCKKNLEIHIVRKHTVVAPEDYERCSKCNKSFKCRPDVIKHEKRCRPEVRKRRMNSFNGKHKTRFNLYMQDHVLHPSVANDAISVPADNA